MRRNPTKSNRDAANPSEVHQERQKDEEELKTREHREQLPVR